MAQKTIFFGVCDIIDSCKKKIKFKLVCSNISKQHRIIGSNKLFKQIRLENSKYKTFDFRLEKYEKVFKTT